MFFLVLNLPPTTYENRHIIFLIHMHVPNVKDNERIGIDSKTHKHYKFLGIKTRNFYETISTKLEYLFMVFGCSYKYSTSIVAAKTEN